jgi:hypothetical protein
MKKEYNRIYVFISHYQYQADHGMFSVWIFSWDFPKLKEAMIPFFSLSIDFPKWHILYPIIKQVMQPILQFFFKIIYKATWSP